VEVFMVTATTRARDVLWEVAVGQHGYFTIRDAKAEGIEPVTVRMLASRGRVTRVAQGLYRFDELPVSAQAAFMEAVLWTGVPGAALSGETVLAVRELCDVNPDRIHLTVPRRHRVRRTGHERYLVHYQDLDPEQRDWWEGVPAVTAACAIQQCITWGTPHYLLRHAIETGRRRGDLTPRAAASLSDALGVRR
jgi:predicted transcriptional regulator of viral defense system